MASTEVQTNFPALQAARGQVPQSTGQAERAPNSSSRSQCCGNSQNCNHDRSSFLPESLLPDSPSNRRSPRLSPSQSRRSPSLPPSQNRQSPRLLHKAKLPTKVNVKKNIAYARRGKGRKRGGSPKKECTDDDHIFHLCDDLETKLAESDVCVNMIGAKDLKCTCLRILKDDVNARLAVSKGILGFLKKDKLDQQNTLIDWHRYASDGHRKTKGHFYFIPFDAIDIVDEPDCPPGLVDKLNRHKICTSSLMSLLQMKKAAWYSMIKSGKTTGSAKPHGHVGNKHRAHKTNSDVMKKFRHFMADIQHFGEVRATRCVEIMSKGLVVGHSNRDNDIKDVYLPPTMGYRPSYGRYLHEMGYMYTKDNNGGYIVKPRDGSDGSATIQNPEAGVLPYSTFFRYWKQEYPNVKVHKAIEDICEQCYIFMHRAQQMTKKSFGTPVSVCDSNDSGSLVDSPARNTRTQIAARAENDTALDESDSESDSESDDEGDLAPMLNSDLDSSLFLSEEDPDDRAHVFYLDDCAKDAMAKFLEETAIAGAIVSHNKDLIESATNYNDAVRKFLFHHDYRAADDDVANEAREMMILRAALHVNMAGCQRATYQHYVKVARQCVLDNTPHEESTYTFVVDYGQNMEVPVFNHQQPGCTYYFSPLGVYNLGVVNEAHKYSEKVVREHLYAHVYHEGTGKKGSNNVASLIMKTLKHMGILDETKIGGELVIIFDNCVGQNKNNTVIKLVSYLTEMGYFKKVTFVFLIVGHTKNTADRMFNLLKIDYRRQNLYTMEQLEDSLDRSDNVSILMTEESDFYDYETFLDMFYRDLSGQVKVNHIFSCSYKEGRVGNGLNMQLRKSNLPQHPNFALNVIKQNFHGRGEGKGKGKFKEAVDSRPTIMRNCIDEYLIQLEAPGINLYKKVEMCDKYKRLVPAQLRDDVLYSDVSVVERDAVKQEKAMRKVTRVEIKEVKSIAAKSVKRKLDLDMSEEQPKKKIKG